MGFDYLNLQRIVGQILSRKQAHREQERKARGQNKFAHFFTRPSDLNRLCWNSLLGPKSACHFPSNPFSRQWKHASFAPGGFLLVDDSSVFVITTVRASFPQPLKRMTGNPEVYCSREVGFEEVGT